MPLSILYVEDDKINFLPTMDALQKQNPGAKQSIVHVIDKDSALTHAKLNLPILLITDLSFFESQGDSTPDPKNGYKMLQGFAKLAQKSKQPPPIWIVTGDDRNAVVSELEEFGISGETYQVAPTETRDKFLTQYGMISILDNSKDLSKKPELLSIIHGLLKMANTSKPDMANNNIEVKTQKTPITVERILLGNKFPENLIGALEEGLGETHKVRSHLSFTLSPRKQPYQKHLWAFGLRAKKFLTSMITIPNINIRSLVQPFINHFSFT